MRAAWMTRAACWASGVPAPRGLPSPGWPRCIEVLRRRLAVGLLLTAMAAPAANAQPCCGPIAPAGTRLARFLDASKVTELWQPGWHVDWQTGESDRSTPGGPEAKTHCSAFVAAMAERLGVYVLRPPQHPQN